jgi:hypothetical protein
MRTTCQEKAMLAGTDRREAPAVRGAAVLAVFESAERAERAIVELQRSSYGASQLSVIGKEELTDASQLGFAAAGSQLSFWGRRGALWRRLSTAPAGAALAWVPYIGHVVAIGPLACVLAGDRGDKGDGTHSVLTRMLRLAGLSVGEIRTYEAAVRGGQILLLVHGPAKDVARARRLLESAECAGA